MRLEIPLIEVQQFISSQYQIDIDLKNTGENIIEATYIDSVVLNIKEIKEGMILIHYEVDGLAHVVSKLAHFFLEKKLDQSPIVWDSKLEEVRIDLNKVPQLNSFLKVVSISEIKFTGNAIALEMHVSGKI